MALSQVIARIALLLHIEFGCQTFLQMLRSETSWPPPIVPNTSNGEHG
jgi:hypothetical protein